MVAEIWSTHDEEVQLNLRMDDFPNGLEPMKKVKLHEGVNRINFKSEAKAAGFATYHLRLSGAKQDESKKNNETVAALPSESRYPASASNCFARTGSNGSPIGCG